MSATMTMNPTPQMHRKPLPSRLSPAPPQQLHHSSSQPHLPAQYIAEQQHRQYSKPRLDSMGMAPSERTSSMMTPPYPASHSQQGQNQQYSQRRTLSNATSSTSSTSTTAPLQRETTNTSLGAPRRSTSSRSASSASPTSYVALMRKQKATVWCDRAQHEDPRILAAQRAAKMRANMEVAGGSHNRLSTSSSNPTGGIRSKIRHHGAPKASTYTGRSNLGGAGVPMRLSASEVDENDSDEEAAGQDSKYMRYHNRTGSGRSSDGSGGPGARSTLGLTNNYHASGTSAPSSAVSTPQGGVQQHPSSDDTPNANAANDESADYFGGSGGSGGSGGAAEQSFGDVGALPKRTRAGEEQQQRANEGKSSEELRRRGSVDDRSMNLGGGRLFVANPDADSD